MEANDTCFSFRRLGMNVLTPSNVCYSIKSGFIKSSRLLSTVSQSKEPILMKEVSCTLQKNLLLGLLQTLPPQAQTLDD